MRTSNVALYALRLTFGQASQASSSQAANRACTAASNVSSTSSSDRLVSRSATMLAVLGFVLSSFSVKQMLANSGNKPITIPLRKF